MITSRGLVLLGLVVGPAAAFGGNRLFSPLRLSHLSGVARKGGADRTVIALQRANSFSKVCEILDTSSLPLRVQHYNAAISRAGRLGASSADVMRLIGRIEAQGINLTPHTYSSAIKAVGGARNVGGWNDALQLLKRCSNPDAVVFGAAVGACKDARCPEACEAALGIVSEMVNNPDCPDPNDFVYCAAIGACGDVGRVDKAIELLEDMESRGLSRNVPVFTALIVACGKAGRWGDALNVLKTMQCELEGRNVGGDQVAAFNAAITACARAGRWREAASIFNEMKEGSDSPNPTQISFNACLGAFERGKRCSEAEALFEEMVLDNRGDHRPDRISVNALMSAHARCGNSSRCLEIALEWFPSINSLRETVTAVCPGMSLAEIEALAEGSTNLLQVEVEFEPGKHLTPDRTSFNILARAFARGGHVERALVVRSVMEKLLAVEADETMLRTLITACEEEANLCEDVFSSGQAEVLLETALILRRKFKVLRPTEIVRPRRTGGSLAQGLASSKDTSKGLGFTGGKGPRVVAEWSDMDRSISSMKQWAGALQDVDVEDLNLLKELESVRSDLGIIVSDYRAQESSIMRLIKKAPTPAAVVLLLDGMFSDGVAPTLWHFNAAISRCTDLRDYAAADTFFARITQETGEQPNVISYTALLQVCCAAARV